MAVQLEEDGVEVHPAIMVNLEGEEVSGFTMDHEVTKFYASVMQSKLRDTKFK